MAVRLSSKLGLTLGLPWVVVAVGLGFATYLGISVFLQDQQRVDDHFYRTAQNHRSALDREFHSNFETVNALSDLFRASESVDREQFQVFARSLRGRHPSIQALEWVPRVTRSNRAALELEARQTYPNFKFWDPEAAKGLKIGDERDVSFPIYYLEPIEDNEEALGYDPSRHTIRSGAIDLAVSSGGLAVSAPTPLVQEESTQLAFLVFVPVFSGDIIPEDSDSRWSELVGLAEGVFKANDVFESAVSALAPVGQNVKLWDVTDSQRLLIHEGNRTNPERSRSSWHTVECRAVYRENMYIGGRIWEVEVRPLNGAFTQGLLHPGGIAAAVSLVSLFLAFALRSLIQRVQRTQRLVQQRTAELTHRTSHDPLTGLVNRSEFDRLVGTTLDQARQTGKPSTVAHLDIDQFRVVNDTYGHAAGDEMLRQFSTALESELGPGETLARLRGDEFGLLLPGRSVDEAEMTVQSLLAMVRSFQFPWMNRIFSIGASFGVVQVDALSPSAPEVLSLADTACAVAKEKGRDRYHVVRVGDVESERHREQTRWLSTVKSALKDDAFRLYRQPIMPLPGHSGPPLSEVLLRLPREDGSVALPGLFLPAAARFRMMNRIDHWVIARVAALIAAGDLGGDSRICVNVSAQTLDEEDFADRVLRTFREAGRPLTNVCFEVTETALIGNVEHARRVIERLREHGSLFALDDFGSGMASFEYLKSLPVDFVKIDGSFVSDMTTNASSRVIVRSIVEAASAFGMRTIAEWVEDEETYEILVDMGVDYAQGYLLGHPEPVRLPS